MGNKCSNTLACGGCPQSNLHSVLKKNHLNLSFPKLKMQCVMANFLGQLYQTEKCLGSQTHSHTHIH